MDLEQFPTSPSAKRMLGTVSEEFYAKSYVGKWLYQVMGLEWDAVWAKIESIPEQAFVETATWGLMYHEIKWGLPVRENLDYETRRRLIYEKRDVKIPMNPWTMEQFVTDITGRPASIRDSNDDSDIPTNTFILQIESGETAVDLSAVIRKIRSLKQSHVDFSIRVCTRTGLVVNTRRTPWRNLFTLTGTVPKTSRGLNLREDLVELRTNPTVFHMDYPMSGTSGNTGQYPKTSRKPELRPMVTQISAETGQYETVFPMTSEDLKTGTVPKPSRVLQQTDAAVTAQGKSSYSRKRFTLTGTEPGTSQSLELRDMDIDVSAEAENHPLLYTLAGTAPEESRRVKQDGTSGTGVSVTTQTYGTRVKNCGGGFNL